MFIKFKDFSVVKFTTVEGLEYTVLPLPDSSLAIPKDIATLEISQFPKSQSDK